MLRTTLLAAAVLVGVGLAPVARAQTAARTDTFTLGNLEVLATCPSAPSKPKSDNGPIQVSGAMFAPILAGFAGDVAAAALNATAAALEEASRAKGVGIEGIAAFEFYDIDTQGGKVAVLPFSKQTCLRLTTPQGLGDGAPASPAFNVEVEIKPLQDGFSVRPLLVDYRRPMTGAPTKPVRAELHIEFSIPAVAQDGATAPSTVFALARLRLPTMSAPGAWRSEALGTGSEVLPYRPDSASLTRLRQRLQPFEQVASKQTDLNLVVFQRAHLLGATVNAAGDVQYPPRKDCVDCDDEELEARVIKGLSESDKQQLKVLDERLAATRVALGEAKARTQPGQLKDLPSAVGTTTVKARFLLIQDENKFGMAVAQAIKTRAPTVATAVAQRLDPPDKPSWTTQKSSYALAQARVERARLGLTTARLAADKTAVESAETEFLNARLELNLAAAALGLPAPHPGPTIKD